MSSYSDEIHHNITQLKQCTTIPPFINSAGVFQGDSNLLEATLPRLELLMFAIFFTSHVFHFILKRFSIPLLVSQILAGMILGKAGLGLHADYRRIMFGIDSDQLFGTIGGFGFQLFAFLNGVKMDLSLIRKTGRMALCSGVLSMVMPVLFGAVTTSIVNSYLGLLELDKLSLSLVMLVHSMTPFPVTCSFVSDLELTHSELGRLGLSAALSSELLTQFLACNAFLVGIFYQYHYQGALKTVAIATAFITLTVFVVRPAMLWVIKQTPEGRPVRDLYISFVVLGALVSGLIFQFIGLNMFLGSLAFGLAVPAGPPLASALVDKFECMVSGVLIPLFMAMCTMKANFREISFDKKLTKGAAIVVTVVSLTKFGACLVTLFYYRMPKQDAFALAFIISSKGIVELGAYAFISESGLFTEGMFSFLAITILVSATVSPIFVNWLYDPSRKYAGYQKRNIMHSKDLCVLACIYRPDNVTSIINFLQALCPTLESPVSDQRASHLALHFPPEAEKVSLCPLHF
ncbi:hypothetical protein NC652_017013 [Populus alba x Populus x berolinensis]|nr:hypothetical protein NC652_017013 [Populus alba x Populus x berolinensis]